MYCKKCGKENESGSKFCIRCGAPLTEGPDPFSQQPASGQSEEDSAPRPRRKWPLALAGALIGAVAAALIVVFLILPGSRQGEGDAAASSLSGQENSGYAGQEAESGSAAEDADGMEDLPGEQSGDDDVDSENHAGESGEDSGAAETGPTPGAAFTQEPVPTVTVTEEPAPGENQAASVSPTSQEELEAEVQEIRDVYYGIQYNLDTLTAENAGGGITRYLDGEGHLRKISAQKGAYGNSLSEAYAAEYYYDTDEASGNPRLRFVFVFGNGEEYRIYLTEEGSCLRYIGPDGVVTDYPVPEPSLETVTDMWPFCEYAREAQSDV